MKTNKKASKGAVVLKDIVDVIVDLAGGSASVWSYHQSKEPDALAKRIAEKRFKKIK